MTTLCAYEGRDLPPIIQRAICRINDPAILQDLSPSQRWFLSVLLRRVSAQNGSDVFWVKRSNFAELTGTSEATVYRTLSKFEDDDLIVRVGQKRSKEGSFSVGEMHLSEKLCLLLGLTGPAQEDDATLYKKKISDRLSPVQDAISINQGVKQFALQKHSLRDQSAKSIGKGTIPDELQGLIEQGLKHSQVFLLMRLARQGGKRLSDIVLVCHAQLASLRGVELFAYLRTLTQADRDFGYIRQCEEAAQHAELERQEQCKRLDALKARFSGKWVRGSQDVLFQLDSAARVSMFRAGAANRWIAAGFLAGESESQFWQRLERGDLAIAPPPPFESYMS